MPAVEDTAQSPMRKQSRAAAVTFVRMWGLFSLESCAEISPRLQVKDGSGQYQRTELNTDFTLKRDESVYIMDKGSPGALTKMPIFRRLK